MSAAHLALLHTLSRACGVQSAYVDMKGHHQPADPEVLVAILAALGVPANTEKQIGESLVHQSTRRWQRGVEPVIVAWDQRATKVTLRLPAGTMRNGISCALKLEDGSTLSLGFDPQRQKPSALTRVRGETYFATELALPALPYGYHALELEIGNRLRRALIVSAPTKGYADRGARDWGIFLPMYAAHSKRSWGAGNFSDWEELCTWISSLGGSVVGTLPLLAAFLDGPTCDPSPYSPVSRLFWNEFYIDITRVPEFAECRAARKLVGAAGFENRIERFRKNLLIDYPAEWKMRRTVLQRLAKSFFEKPSARRAEFERFLRERPQIQDYACFRATCDRQKLPWHSWPQRLRDGDLQSTDYDEGARSFHVYVQWLAQAQMDHLIAHCQKGTLQLYLDLPLGVHPDGYDVWRERSCFSLEASVGAPPDAFFFGGQNWGFAPFHPERLREEGYRHVLDFLRFQMHHAGLLRIDHVMGLHRLYWIPKGFSPKQGAYVKSPAEEWYAILSLESHRHKTRVIGENLGTVPPEVNASMQRHGLRNMFVAQFEQRPHAKAAMRIPKSHSIASINTHDMPPFAAHWHGLDILDHAALGLVSEDQLHTKRSARRKLNQALARFLKQKGLLRTRGTARALIRACLLWLGRSPAEIVLVNLEDLFGEKIPQNTPGTHRERPNWRRKAKLDLEDIIQQPEIQETLRALNRTRKRRELA